MHLNLAIHWLLGMGEVGSPRFVQCPLSCWARCVRTRLVVLAGLLCLSTAVLAETNSENTNPNPPDRSTPVPDVTLTNASSVLALLPTDAGRKLPVHIVGQVVYSDPGWGIWFINDKTAGIRLTRSAQGPAIALGNMVEVEGVSRLDGADLMVDERSLKVLRIAPLPEAAPITVDQLVDVLTDGRWVEMDAVVESVRLDGGHLHLALSAVRDIRVFIPVPSNVASPPENWVDARLRFRGVWTTKANNRGQFVANHLYVPSLEQVQVLVPRHIEAERIPVQSLEKALRFNAHAGESRRIKVAGVVTAMPTKNVFYIQEGATGLRVHTRQVSGYALGDQVQVVGFPTIDGGAPQLEESLVERLGAGTSPKPAIADASSGALEDGSLEGVLTEIEGETVGVVPRGPIAELVVRSGGKYISTRLPGTNAVRELSHVKPLSRVRITGVCVLPNASNSLFPRPHLLLRSVEDVMVLAREPWWTVPRAMGFLVIVSAILVLWRLRGWRHELGIRERYRLIFENAMDLVCTQSAEGRFVDANPAWVNVTGYSLPALREKCLLDMVAPAGRMEFASWWSRLLAGGQVESCQVELATRTGAPIHIEMSCHLVGSAGDSIRVETIARDITARKQAEVALQLSDFSVNHASLPTFWIASDSRILRANRAASDLLGYTEAELATLSITDLDPNFPSDGWAGHWRELRERKRMSFETQHKRKDGRVIPVEVDLNWFEFEGREYNFAFSRDISARKHMAAIADGQRRILEMIAGEAPLRETLDALLAMIESQADGMICSVLLLDDDGVHLRHGSAPSLPESFVKAVDNVAIGQNIGSCGTAVYLRKPVFVADIGTDPLWADYKGIALPLGLHACWSTPIFDARDNVLGAFAIYYKKPGLPSQQHLDLIKAATDTAAIAIGRQQARVALAATEAQLRQVQKLEGIGQLAGGVAHDFNNILTSISMQIDLVDAYEELPEQVREGLGQIRADTHRAAELTRQLLLFGRRQVMQMGVVDINKLVFNLGKMLQRIIGEDVELQLRLTSAPLVTRADSGMLEQVLMNLAVNSRDAMPGGGRLTIGTAETYVDDETARRHRDAVAGRYVTIRVSDTGKGIPPEILPRIFEPFFTTKAVGKGTGLGLATVFGIVAQHRGWIVVDNRPGEGVAFDIFLPACASTVVDASPVGLKPELSGGTETILLVEDEPAVRKLIRTILERHRYTVLEAGDGMEALALWEKNSRIIDLLLTDLIMPGGMNGQEIAARLRLERPNLKIVFSSGYSADIAGRDFRLKNGEAFIQKPFAAEQLFRAIRQCLEA